MFTLTGTSPSRLSSVPSPSPSENVWRDGTGPTCSILIMWAVITSSPLCFECLLAMRPAGLSSEMDEELIELARKCDELHEISHKKYSDSVWKEKLWRWRVITYASFYHSEQHFSLLRLISMLLLLTVFRKRMRLHNWWR